MSEVDYVRINETMGKMEYYLSTHNKIGVSVSGGSDSNVIVHIIATYFRHYLDKITFYWINTGLEYAATKRHLKFMEERYNIKIEEVKGMPIPLAVKKYGVPLYSKAFCEVLMGMRNGAKWAFDCFNGRDGTWKEISKANRSMANAVMESGINISNKCCKKSKKEPAHRFTKTNHIDLTITGERKAEGGVRARSHKSCFEGGRKNREDKYMPLWFWNDATKQYYKEHEGIRYSDCYEVWGFKRTGCVGCPFNSKVGKDLQIIKQYEPQMYKACINIFGESYRLMDKYLNRKDKVFSDEEQLDLFGLVKESEKDGV